ncbi:hypothetical protein Mgra_00001474 [Meloidogyne graminicola]|uniref:Uncharacterized protein n=1 Tax=Meloidogyne graminicola TaxID=189291 RepID=A0A8T0A081_9BILA|nr:hypothetical protein Mgra_00001474 [Meloidogyne graminicola]
MEELYVDPVEEREKRHKGVKTIEGLEYVKYKAQQEQEILELNTDEDKVTTITEKNIIKKVRDVYGQKAEDLKNVIIDWSTWGVELNPKNRPNPYEFPAFLRAVEDGKVVGGKKGGEKSHYKSGRHSKKVKDESGHVAEKSSADYSVLPTAGGFKIEEEEEKGEGGGGGGEVTAETIDVDNTTKEVTDKDTTDKDGTVEEKGTEEDNKKSKSNKSKSEKKSDKENGSKRNENNKSSKE